MVGEDRRDAGGEAQEKGGEQHFRIKDDGDSRDAVFSRIAQGQQVEQEGGDAHGQLGHHFRGAVLHGLQDDAPLEAEPPQAEQ